MKPQEFTQELNENIGKSTYSIFKEMQKVDPRETIIMSYDLYRKMLEHPSFSVWYCNFREGHTHTIEYVIPGRVMLMKTGHLIVVV